MRRNASQQRAAKEQNAVQAIVRRLECIDRVLSLYDQNLTTSQDADHLTLNALLPTIRQLVTQLVETSGELREGARMVGQRLHTSAKINLASEAGIMHLDVCTIDYCVHSAWSVWRWVATLKCFQSVVATLGYLPCFLTHFTTPSHLHIHHLSTHLPDYPPGDYPPPP